ncbi:hypothetical protein Tco_1309338 [Tanacetum coccineum]
MLLLLITKMVDARGSTPKFLGPAFKVAVQRSVHALLPGLTIRLTNEILQNGAGGSGDQPPTIHTWLERFKQQKYEREYHTIRQRDGETSGEFMKRFLRLAGFVGKKAGPPKEQAKHFKWALYDWILDGIVNMEFTDVAQVANAARNIEILCERSSQNNRRNRDGTVFDRQLRVAIREGMIRRSMTGMVMTGRVTIRGVMIRRVMTVAVMTGKVATVIRSHGRTEVSNTTVLLGLQVRKDTQTIPLLLHVTHVGNFIRARHVTGLLELVSLLV